MTRTVPITDQFREYQERLRLQDWDIRFHDEWDADKIDNSAETFISMGPRAATVTIHPDVVGPNLDAHIVHELTHIVLADYVLASKNAIAKLGPGAEAVLDILGDMEERICDTIAHALTGVTYIPVVGDSKKYHAPFVDTTTCTD